MNIGYKTLSQVV